jgi:hypothetical protein
MSTRWRRRATALTALTALLVGTGVAGAAWLGQGKGDAVGKAGGPKVTVMWEDGDLEALGGSVVEPGFSGDAVVRVINESRKALQLLQISTPESPTVGADDVVCGLVGDPATPAVTATTFSLQVADLQAYVSYRPAPQDWLLTWPVPTAQGLDVLQPGEVGWYLVPDVFWMAEEADDSCQGQRFWVQDVTVTATYAP